MEYLVYSVFSMLQKNKGVKSSIVTHKIALCICEDRKTTSEYA